MVDFRISEEIKEVVSALDKFIDVEVEPLREKFKKELEDERYLYDENGVYVKEIQEAMKQIRVKSADAGFYNMFGDPRLGGNGDEYGPVSVAVIFEGISKKYGVDLFTTEIFPRGLFSGGLTPVLLGMNKEVMEEVLPEISSGETVLCFGLSEPDAGSDVWNMRTKAEKDGEHWVINGTKQWITNAHYAKYMMTFAITDQALVDQRKGGISCFLVPIDGKTCTATSTIQLLGHLGSATAIVSLENARVHERYLIGDLHQGFGKALHGVDIGRVVMASQCVGVAKWALKIAVNYANERKTFGTTIGNHQAIQMMLAECALDIYAGKNMLLNCAWKLEHQSELPIKEISMIKAFCTEMSQRVVDKCMQIHGGMGLTNELKLEKAWRWARVTRVPDGTTEIQKRTIARRLLQGDMDL
ncbi:acyl-CoA dehydrogenase family protein [Lysinibacillus sp. NPDC097287]|uniref:acyl-CoA dehydrogenase family protein n=1 Tax=Lysinibacillus sp. NPDC097287 TaxID=3364144 RepID=UPI003829A621